MIDAMVFAAGLGTRLRPLTDDLPKALIRVGGTTVLERTVRRLAGAGAERIVVNAHHHLPLVEREVGRLAALGLRTDDGSGPAVDLRLSPEPARPLETGGGLRHAASLFHGDRPILLHNVDVVSEVDLRALAAAHERAGRAGGPRPAPPLATLAVHDRRTSRQLLFDAAGLYGRRHVASGRTEIAREPHGPRRALGFAGLHVVAGRLPGLLPDEEVFSITDAYLRLAARGERIAAHDVSGAAWWEIGTPERLVEARRALER